MANQTKRNSRYGNWMDRFFKKDRDKVFAVLDALTELEGIDNEEKQSVERMIEVGGEGILGERTLNQYKWRMRPPANIYWNGLKNLKS